MSFILSLHPGPHIIFPDLSHVSRRLRIFLNIMSQLDQSICSGAKFAMRNLKCYQPASECTGCGVILHVLLLLLLNHIITVPKQHLNVDNGITAFKLVHSLMSLCEAQFTILDVRGILKGRYPSELPSAH